MARISASSRSPVGGGGDELAPRSFAGAGVGVEDELARRSWQARASGQRTRAVAATGETLAGAHVDAGGVGRDGVTDAVFLLFFFRSSNVSSAVAFCCNYKQRNGHVWIPVRGKW